MSDKMKKKLAASALAGLTSTKGKPTAHTTTKGRHAKNGCVDPARCIINPDRA